MHPERAYGRALSHPNPSVRLARLEHLLTRIKRDNALKVRIQKSVRRLRKQIAAGTATYNRRTKAMP